MEQDLLTMICGSVDTQMFSVEYYLRCFVKHDAVFEIGQGNCVQFPLNIVIRPDTDASAALFDNSFRPNSNCCEFDPSRDLGDCTFQINKAFPQQPASLKQIKVSEDHNLHRAKFNDKLILDFENVPLPNIGDKDVVCIGFENGQPWPDHTEIYNSDWVLQNQCQNPEAWLSADDGLSYDQTSKMNSKMISKPPQTLNYQTMPKEEEESKKGGSAFDDDIDDDEF